MKKRGLSAVITTLIIILLVLVAVGVVWVVIANLINQGAEEISLGKFTINMEIKDVKVDSSAGTIDVVVKRNTGKGDLTGIKFLVSDGVDVQEFTEETTMGELGQQTFNLPYSGLVKDVSIAPIFTLESGKESLGNEIDKEEIPKEKIIENLGGISWWKFEGNAQDELEDNDGTINGANCDVNGKFGKACDFDGVNDWINCSNHESLNPTDAMTIALWFKMAQDISVAWANVIGNWHYVDGISSTGYGLFRTSSNEQISFAMGFDGENDGGVSNIPITYDDWQHVAMTYDKSQGYIRAYLNGVEVGTPNTRTSSILYNPASNFMIGSNQASSQKFKGKIDEPMVFNRALSEDEIKALYELDLS